MKTEANNYTVKLRNLEWNNQSLKIRDMQNIWSKKKKDV